METNDKIKENRLRRMAKRQGLCLKKSRRRDPRAVDFDGYMLVDAYENFVVVGGGAFFFSATLEDVEDYLTRPLEKQP
ncbi:MAG: hypothetical protein HQL62_02385 [Magnetococcales bacterium]|nr:hypothetical protein [Magnetococcales bacterium]